MIHRRPSFTDARPRHAPASQERAQQFTDSREQVERHITPVLVAELQETEEERGRLQQRPRPAFFDGTSSRPEALNGMADELRHGFPAISRARMHS